MLSRSCHKRHENIIPRLLEEHSRPQVEGKSLIDLSTAENHFMKTKIVEYSGSSRPIEVTSSDLGYSNDIGGSRVVRGHIATLYNEHICPSGNVPLHDIVLGAGATCILDALIESICDPGDGVMIATPYWSGLNLSICIRNQAKIVEVEMPLDEFFTPTSLKYYEHALQSALCPVKAVFICNPHNPLGKCYPLGVLRSMQHFCRINNLHLISDEVYALSLHANDDVPLSQQFLSARNLDDEGQAVHIVYSLSKDFGCNGIRLGALVSRNHKIRMSIALSTYGQETIAALNEPNRRWLKDSCSLVEGFCHARHLRFVPATAGLFVFAQLWIDASATDEKRSIKELRSQGVIMASGTSYHFKERGWFRLCFGVERERLKEALRRLGKALDALKDASIATSHQDVLLRRKRRRDSRKTERDVDRANKRRLSDVDAVHRITAK